MVEISEKGYRKIFLALCAIGLFAILSSTMSKTPVLNLFAASLGTPSDWTGFVAAASTIPGILISLPAGSLSDRFGRRKMLLISGIIFASAPFLYLLINSWWELIAVRFYHGFATAIFVPVANATIVELFPEKKGERISTFSSFTLIGRGIAPFLGGSLLAYTNNNFSDLYIAVGVAGLTSLLVGFPLMFAKTKGNIDKGRIAAPSSMISGWKTVAKNRGVQLVGFVEAVQYYVYGSVEYFLVGYLKDVAGLNTFLIGVVSGGYIIIVMLMKPVMGRISDRAGRRVPITAGALIMGLPLLGIPFSSNFVVIVALTLIYGLGFAIVTSSTPALACELVSRLYLGTSMGFLSTIMDIGQAIGPIICGFILASSFGYVGLFVSLTVLLLFSSALFLASGIGKERPAK